MARRRDRIRARPDRVRRTEPHARGRCRGQAGPEARRRDRLEDAGERAADHRLAGPRHPERGAVQLVPRREPERGAGDHRPLALLRAHDVQRREEVRPGRVRPGDGGRGREQQRLHHRERDRLPGLVPAHRARDDLRPRAGPARAPRVRPEGHRERARGRLLRAPLVDRQRQHRPLDGAGAGPGVPRAPVPVPGGRLAERHRGLDPRRPRALLQDLLRAEQRDADRERRRHPGRGVRARRAHRRQAQAPARAGEGPHRRAGAAGRAPPRRAQGGAEPAAAALLPRPLRERPGRRGADALDEHPHRRRLVDPPPQARRGDPGRDLGAGDVRPRVRSLAALVPGRSPARRRPREGRGAPHLRDRRGEQERRHPRAAAEGEEPRDRRALPQARDDFRPRRGRRSGAGVPGRLPEAVRRARALRGGHRRDAEEARDEGPLPEGAHRRRAPADDWSRDRRGPPATVTAPKKEGSR